MNFTLVPRRIKERRTSVSVIGLGFVGLPLALALARKAEVIGYDTDAAKIERYRSGTDVTGEVGDAALRRTTARFTYDERALAKAGFHIIAVPTPVDREKRPDLGPLLTATGILGRNLCPGAIVVYDSTVYPGVTEEICLPLLESRSGLQAGVDFKVGYSPERINPGDRRHTLSRIAKLVAGMDGETTEAMAAVYRMVVTAGIYKCASIKVAEAAKVMENAQRDVNIAFMNEMAVIFKSLGLETREVLAAARTRWNFLDFRPGLVGGHCTAVDRYYLIRRAEESGLHPTGGCQGVDSGHYVQGKRA